MHQRRNEFDVSNTICVSRPASVLAAVSDMFSDVYQETICPAVTAAFADFQRLYEGGHPGYFPCETSYHDIQHCLDVTLAFSRLLAAHESHAKKSKQLGIKRSSIGIISALFHDVGYLRKKNDKRHQHGAEYTRVHVTRGANFLSAYLLDAGFDKASVADAAASIHYTGYEKDFSAIRISDPLYRLIGHMLGTADLVAQMSDRCYLEKCRDRLFREFALGGINRYRNRSGHWSVRFSSPHDLLRKTPQFFNQMQCERLDGEFSGLYQQLTHGLSGENLYLVSMLANQQYLAKVLKTNGWEMLRRRPPNFAAVSRQRTDQHFR